VIEEGDAPSAETGLDPVPTFGGNAQFPSSKLEELPTGIGAAAPGGRFTKHLHDAGGHRSASRHLLTHHPTCHEL
jgi:hypothetical protein